MPTIKPSGGEVDWPETEGTLGIVGVAPWATIAFCEALYKQVTATKDWHYPRIIADINTKLPSRGRHFQLGEADPSPAIAATISELHDQGATAVVVPCNTAHILYPKWAANAPVPVPHIVRETLAMASRAGARKMVALTSASLSSYDLYGKFAGEFNLISHRLGREEQAVVSEMIEDVKVNGAISDATLLTFDRIAETLKSDGVDAMILGCAELTSLLERFKADGLQLFDSNVALAMAALIALNVPSHLIDADQRNAPE